MPRTLNPVRNIKTQIGTRFDCVAYVVDRDGTPMHLINPPIPVSGDEPEEPEEEEPEDPENSNRGLQGLPYILEARLFEEFGQRRSWSLPPQYGVVHTPKGTTSSPDNRWSSAIDGVRGFNLTYVINADNLLWANSAPYQPMQVGWYRLVLTLLGGIKQEFGISVRG